MGRLGTTSDSMETLCGSSSDGIRALAPEDESDESTSFLAFKRVIVDAEDFSEYLGASGWLSLLKFLLTDVSFFAFSGDDFEISIKGSVLELCWKAKKEEDMGWTVVDGRISEKFS